MILDLELNDAIYNALETNAIERGITVKELIRWIVGDYMRFSQGPPSVRMALPISPFPGSEDKEQAKILKLSGFLMKSMIKQGGIKCSTCTMPLDVEELEAGKCSKCQAEIE